MTHRIKPGTTMAIALAAVMLTTAAIADTEATVTVAAQATAVKTSDEVSRDLANEATTVATEKAIASVLADTKLDLDIRLIGPTSTRVAGDR